MIVRDLQSRMCFPGFITRLVSTKCTWQMRVINPQRGGRGYKPRPIDYPMAHLVKIPIFGASREFRLDADIIRYGRLAKISRPTHDGGDMMRHAFAITAVLALLCLGITAQADVFNLGEGFTNLETVTVGDPGNAADTRYSTPGYGSVNYTYNIGKYEVTAAQYCDFLNHKAKTDPKYLYHADMWDDPYGCKIQRSGSEGSYTYSVASDWANRPVNFVTFMDACRFVNWLHNGQGNGDTETGAYTLSGEQANVHRSANAKWYLLSEDEWYKAAYYKGGGINAGYWDYPMQSDVSTTPSNDLMNPDPGNNANFYQNGYTIGSPYYRTNVGEFEESKSAYSTFDQGGNVWEWNEATYEEGSDRGLRGGAFYYDDYYLQASIFHHHYASYASYGVGFRVASSIVPEPSSIVVLVAGMGSLLAARRRGR